MTLRDDAVLLLRQWVEKGAPVRECGEMIDRILSLVEADARRREREAFKAGADWAVKEDYGDMGCEPALVEVALAAARRYPEEVRA